MEDLERNPIKKSGETMKYVRDIKTGLLDEISFVLWINPTRLRQSINSI